MEEDVIDRKDGVHSSNIPINYNTVWKIEFILPINKWTSSYYINRM